MIDFLSFEEAIVYVKSLDVYGSVLGLSNMIALATELDNPQDSLRFVHITGTNGKGSVSAFLASILTEAGYKVGAYNSPAVLSDIDQFSINTEIITTDLYARAVSIVKNACDTITARGGVQPTRFEVETMVAFEAFKIAECDIVVLETGLGGRDDATNIIKNTLVHVFTSISMDHIAILGDSLSDIAMNKVGIIKSNAPTVMYYRDTSGLDDLEATEVAKACDVISNCCKVHGSKLVTVCDSATDNIFVKNDKLHFDIPSLNLFNLKLKMCGAYQPYNAAVAVYAIRELLDKGYVISKRDIEKGLKKAFIPFRFEVEKAKVDITYNSDEMSTLEAGCKSGGYAVDIILDGAHNPDGARKLMNSLRLIYPDRKYIYVTGIFRDKDYEKIASITGKQASKIFIIRNTDTERSLEADKLSEVFLKYNKNVVSMGNVKLALGEAIKEAAAYEVVSHELASHEVVSHEATLNKCKDDSVSSALLPADKPVVVCFGSLSWLKYVKGFINNI